MLINSFPNQSHADSIIDRFPLGPPQSGVQIQQDFLKYRTHPWTDESLRPRDEVQYHSIQHHPTKNRSPSGILDAYLNTCQRWNLNENERFVLLGLNEESNFARELLAGNILKWNIDIRDRIGYIVGISLGLGSMFREDVEAEIIWLSTPREQLRNLAPLQYMLKGQIVNLLAVSELVRLERGI